YYYQNHITMKNPVYADLKHADGSSRNIIIEPVLQADLADTHVYKIYKTSIDNESGLFTEQLEINEGQAALADKDNPDYLGAFTFPQTGPWHYDGDLLSNGEQQQIISILQQKA
ncbi:MAG TPA: hypothetical protein VIM77_01275, partial [Mucilaginibacter sp.]